MSSFAELNLPESVARALADRNYENAMPVQAAVLDARCVGRDLLVSSQTGSGKTIAFGVALTQTLLPDPTAKFTRKPQPSALVIVPTRELAAQVREELGWLLRHTGMRLASFTGGTSVMGDLTALKQGVDVAIGTPGRLVDLVGRGRLDLAQIAVLVLDEADEMLDLGFRDDLETLLKAAPVERRTLLLSATLPPAIRELARKFQRDALPVDPRSESGADRTAAHEDIAFVAHLIAGPDRRNAVVNILRASDAERAIVFCTTREGVGELHRGLVARGFTATAISGDRAQAERDRALDQVRRGEARVLVATNVAARGIHLPDVDLIIHCDLPLNAESLTHRSGRTGRAGRKGTAVLLATSTDRRKAERLLAMAHAKATWTPVPSADQIAKMAGERLVEQLTDDAAKLPDAQTARVQELLQNLGGKIDEAELLRRLLARELDRLPTGESVRHISISAEGRGGYEASSRAGASSDRRPRSPDNLSADAVLFRVNMGANDKADPRWMLPLICRRGGVTNREVGAIRIGPRETFFEIARGAAADFALAASETDPRAPHVRIERANGEARGPHPRTERPSARRVPYARTERPLIDGPPEPRVEHVVAKPEPIKREPKPESRAEPKPEPKPEPAKTESLKPVAAKTESPKPVAAKTESPKPVAAKPELPKSEPHRPSPPTQPRAERPHAGAPKPYGSPRPAHPRAERSPAPSFGEPHARPAPPRAERPQPRAERPAFGAPHARPAHPRTERPQPRGERPSFGAPHARPAHAPAERPQPRGERPAFGAPHARPTHAHAPHAPTNKPAHVPGERGATPTRATEGNSPAFRSRTSAKVEIARKVHPPSHVRTQPPAKTKPKTK